MKYSVIVADPPWPQKKSGLRLVRPKQGRDLDYETMPVESIKTHLEVFGEQFAADHVLFLWAIDKFLPEAIQMGVDLGYKTHARLVWDKINGPAAAFTVRYSHEYCLWLYKGHLLTIEPTLQGQYTTVMREMHTKHSRKPNCFWNMVNALYRDASPKIELFARERRPDWYAWGKEVPNDEPAA